MLIDDLDQRFRAKENFALAIDSAVRGEVCVNHDPSRLVITCGSACNIRCKFCYNCKMDYNPSADDLLAYVDRYSRNLVLVDLTGGEPLVTKAGRAILEQISDNKFKFGVRLGTNAQYVDFSALERINLVEVQISSDGATKEVYESVRVGGNFDDLLDNINRFMKLKEKKPYMTIRLNYTLTSDNYMDIPAAVEIYEGMGLFPTFHLVIREKDDPQNIKERKELHKDLLEKVDSALEISKNVFTRDTLINIRHTIEHFDHKK